MDNTPDQTAQLQLCLDRLRGGDGSARDELLSLACDRLGRLTHKMLKGYPGVGRWEQTDDVLQNAALRLRRALTEIAPASLRSFFNLAAVQIRRELIDLSRHYGGPQGMGAHHESRMEIEGGSSQDSSRTGIAAADTDDPARLASWTEFHGRVGALPDLEREVFNLIWYQGLSQSEAAEVLNVTERVVKWRWRAARLRIHRVLDGHLPGS
jgi:RNA polymerase sigma factor (sigma-70 family)